jgi:Myb DNA-binding like
MSSAVSLVPSIKAASKKRRPAFRPGGSGARKQPVKKVTLQVDEDLAKPNAENEPPEDHTDAQAQEDTGKVETQELASQPPIGPPSSPKRRATRRNKITFEGTRQTNETPQANDPKNKSKKRENEAAPAQTSLAIYCTKYRAQKRPKQTNLPAPALPPPPPEEEEEAPPAGPQVKIVDGEIVLQESSMMVPSARKTVQEVEEEYQHVVEEEGHTTIVGASYNSFVARRKPQHWAVEETKLFYHALRQVGADFVTMEAFYKNRTRKQLKKKYQTEQVKNPHLIELALDPRNKLPVDLTIFEVDRDSIVVTKQPLVPRTSGRTVPPTDTPTAPLQTNIPTVSRQVEQTKESTPEEKPVAQPPQRDIFDGFDQLQDVDVTNFVLEQEMAIEKPPSAAIPLAPTAAQKSKSKRPKFRAGMRKGK